jgi:hypothetical protein
MPNPTADMLQGAHWQQSNTSRYLASLHPVTKTLTWCQRLNALPVM